MAEYYARKQNSHYTCSVKLFDYSILLNIPKQQFRKTFVPQNIIAYEDYYFKKYSLTEILTKFLRPYSLSMDTQRDSNHSRFSKFLMVLNTF